MFLSLKNERLHQTFVALKSLKKNGECEKAKFYLPEQQLHRVVDHQCGASQHRPR